MPTTKKTVYHEPNDTYFKEHLSEFVKKHGGEWVVIAGGQLIGFARKDNISALIKNAREQFFVVGDGSFIPANVIKIPVEIGNEKIIADIAFSEKLNIGFNLL